eukprot:2239273-Rhodomonas_salina.2
MSDQGSPPSNTHILVETSPPPSAPALEDGMTIPSGPAPPSTNTSVTSANPAITDAYTPPGPDTLAWTCQVDPVDYGEAIRHAISFLDKKSSQCGHKTMVKHITSEQAQMAEALNDESQFDTIKLQFIAHVVDLLEFAAARALRNGDHKLHTD